MVQRSLQGGRAFCQPPLLSRLSRFHAIHTALHPGLATAVSLGRPSLRFAPNLSPLPLNTEP